LTVYPPQNPVPGGAGSGGRCLSATDPAAAPARRVGRGGHEGGESLVEFLVAVAIMGIAVVAIISALGTAIRFSSLHSSQAYADNVLVSAADSVRSQSYVACPGVSTSSYSPSQNVTFPSGWSASNVAVTAVTGWNGSSFAACSSTDKKLELVTVTATSPFDGSASSIDVVKRDPS